MDVQAGKRELYDCATCQRNRPVACVACPIDEQPFITPRVKFLMDLWQRLQRYPGTLPGPGGLMDQEERLMRHLDVVHDRVTAREPKPNREADAGTTGRRGPRRKRGKP